MKPILFNTEMVRAILEGRKTVTRRVLKLPSNIQVQDNGLYTLYAEGTCYENQHIEELEQYLRQPYKVGDVLYVRETWYKGLNRVLYKANYSDNEKFYENGKQIQLKWKPSIHMPKEATRIFLRVTDVRVERLQDITEEQAWKEGILSECAKCKSFNSIGCQDCANEHEAYYDFMNLWDSTIKKDQLKYYGCEANPYVWVIEFERVERGDSL